jgi:hypothetical protein
MVREPCKNPSAKINDQILMFILLQYGLPVTKKGGKTAAAQPTEGAEPAKPLSTVSAKKLEARKKGQPHYTCFMIFNRFLIIKLVQMPKSILSLNINSPPVVCMPPFRADPDNLAVQTDISLKARSLR